MRLVTEGKARIVVPDQSRISKKLPVFYNPVMEFNRSASVYLLNAIGREMQIGLPLSGSGIRGIRFLLELDRKIVKNITFNDLKPGFEEYLREQLAQNNIAREISISNIDANQFLLASKGFAYIDIDPFGTPNPFLDSAIRRVSRGGILAVTATDTSALAGTYPKATRRKYWAKPLHDSNMHEAGLRILIRKAQLVGAQYDRALVPVFSYSRDHYYRIFFLAEKGKSRADRVLDQHGLWKDAGPMWLGRLWDSKIAEKMISFADEKDKQFLQKIADESRIDSLGITHIHSFCKEHKVKKLPKKQDVIEAIRKKGSAASETHISPEAIRTDISEEALLRIIA